MVWLDFIIAAIIAGVLAAAIVSLAARRRDVIWPGFWFYFVILLLGTWATRLWLQPTLWPGFGWHVLLMAAIGIVIALAMLVTVLPGGAGHGAPSLMPRRTAGPPIEDLIGDAEAARAAPEVAQYSYGLMFWVLVVALVGAIAAGLVVGLGGPTP